MKPKFSLLILVAAACLAGCNIGMQPSGPSPAEIEAHKKSLPPQEQIRLIQTSPMAPADKQAKIAEIEKQYGIKADAAPTRGGPN